MLVLEDMPRDKMPDSRSKKGEVMVAKWLETKLGLPHFENVNEATELVAGVNELLKLITTIEEKKVAQIRQLLMVAAEVKGNPEELRDTVKLLELAKSITPEQLKEFDKLLSKIVKLVKGEGAKELLGILKEEK